jgi:predicted peroxiredoxin
MTDNGHEDKTVVVCNHDDPGSIMPTLVMGASAASIGDRVLLFFCPGGARALVKGALEKIGQPKGLPYPIDLFNTILENGGKIILCELALEAKDIRRNDVRDGVEIMNAPSFLLDAQGAGMTFTF